MAALTPDELIEKAAEAAYVAAYGAGYQMTIWRGMSDPQKDHWRRIARAVIAVLAAEPVAFVDLGGEA